MRKSDNKRNNPSRPTAQSRSISVKNGRKGNVIDVSGYTSRCKSPERRAFLRQAGVISAAMLGGPVLLQGCGGGGGGSGGSATTQIGGSDPMPDTIAVSPESRPVLEFNDPDPTHLLSIDLRSEANLSQLNEIWGADTYTSVGNLHFDSHRGVVAADEVSGLEIDLARILDPEVRFALAGEGQLTIELESNRIADPWLLDDYLYRYTAIRNDASKYPASTGLEPFPGKAWLWQMIAEDGISGPSIQGPQPESPSGLGTYANNLSIRHRTGSLQDMRIGIHTAMHDEFIAVTTAWWAPGNFTAYTDGMPVFLAGPNAVGPNGVHVEQFYYMMTDVPSSAAAKQRLRLFFGRTNVYIRRLIIGASKPYLPLHPLFREWASYGDSFANRGGQENGRLPVADMWDENRLYYFISRLAKVGYRAGWCWNNSLGGGSFRKAASKSLWENGGYQDLESLKSRNPSYVMMSASHNDAAYIGRGGTPGTAEYLNRLAEFKQDFLEHVEVILTGQSPNWNKPTPAGDARIGIISVPISPRAPGWDENEAQAQRDINAFVLDEVHGWVRSNLGEGYFDRLATYDVAALFGPQELVDYHPLFERDGTGTHPNWEGHDLLDHGWWQCALELVNR